MTNRQQWRLLSIRWQWRATVGNGGVVSGGGGSMDGGIVGGDSNGRDGGIVGGDGDSRDGGIVGGDVGIAGGRFFGLEP